MEKKAFGERVRQARKDNSITSEALASLCDVNPVFIRQIEAGTRLPSLPVFVKICRALQTEPNYFLLEEIGKEASDEEYVIELLAGVSGKKKKVVLQVLETLIHELNTEW